MTELVGIYPPERQDSGEGNQIKTPRERSHVHKFSQLIFKHAKNIDCTYISHEFDYGGSASLDMRIMEHLFSELILILI